MGLKGQNKKNGGGLGGGGLNYFILLACARGFVKGL